MTRRTLLTATSALSVLLFTIHFADDVVRGMEPGTLKNWGTFPIGMVWLYGAFVLRGRWASGVMLLGGLLGLLMTYAHYRGAGLGAGSRIAGTDGALFYVWTLTTLGVVALLAVAMAVQGLVRPSWLDEKL